MNFKLMRNILIEDVGLVIQPNIPWLGASPDGKVIDNFNVPSRGLIEVKCPFTKRDCDIFGLVENDDFYIALDEKKKSISKEKPPVRILYKNSSCNGIIKS